VPILSYLLTALGAYLLGSIPTGYLAAKAKGIDIRTVGSGNIGATNAMRVLGKPVGIGVLLVDALKGFAAVMWLPLFVLNQFASPDFWTTPFDLHGRQNLIATFSVIAGVGAVLGHNYTCWLKFKGGKGIATSAGVFLALAPLALGICVVVFAVALLLTRYVSVGSIAAALALPVAVWFTRDDTLLRLVTIILGALAIYKHKTNIQRLIAGTENRMGAKKESK
jgi:glycerol-3-phosphate acyltransferase PlsY